MTGPRLQAILPLSAARNNGAATILERIKALRAVALDILTTLDWLPTLLTRLFVGYFFFETGWAKIHDLSTFTQRFAEWGIPYPAFNAALSAWTETLGGAATLLGLMTRLVSIPMIINMAVAVLTVKLAKVSGLNDFVELDEPLYALAFLWLMFSGAGKVSIDHLLMKVFARS
jgi:putative oxidoreductase